MLFKNFRPAYLLAALPLALASGTALTFDEGDSNQADDKAEATDTSRAVDTIELADRVAAYAIERGDAAMLVQAARLKAGIPTQEGEATEEGAAEAGDDKDGGVDFSVAGLLDQAEVLGYGNDAVLAMVADARAEATRTRGRVGGPSQRVRVVSANSRFFVRNVNFYGGQPARVWLAGDGDTDLDLYIWDENGNRICASLGAWDRESCSWTPRWTGAFTIEVRNLGGVWNEFALTTN